MRDGSQVDDRVQAAELIVRAEDDVQTAIVAEVYVDVAAAPLACAVHVEHVVTVLCQSADHAPAQFSASAGYGNPHGALLDSGWYQPCCFMDSVRVRASA